MGYRPPTFPVNFSLCFVELYHSAIYSFFKNCIISFNAKSERFFFFLILFYRPCSADDSFEFIDFPDMANKTEEPPPGKLQPDPKVSTLEPVPSVVGSKESQTDKDCKSVNLCNDDKTSSQNSNMPNEEDLTKGHQDTPSCSSCSCDQSVSSDDQVDQSECMCSKDKPVNVRLICSQKT